MYIESAQNQRIKNLIKLQQKSRERKNQGVFLVEGFQENDLALKAGFEAVEFYICDEIFDGSIDLNNYKVFKLSPALFEKLAYRKTTGGILGMYKVKENSLNDIQLKDRALVVVLESIEKPGNLGAVLRTCDAAGVDLLIVCDPLVDFYNPNVIRSSVGTVFTNQIAVANQEEVVDWLKLNQVKIYSTYLRDDTKNLYAIDFREKIALILGTENSGLSDFWLEVSDDLIKIPMHGKVDSLNISNAAAICIYEAVRQKSENS